MQVVDNGMCRRDRDGGRGGDASFSSARWQWDHGRQQCMAYTISRPLIREKPRYIDVTIEGVGKQRVWF